MTVPRTVPGNPAPMLPMALCQARFEMCLRVGLTFFRETPKGLDD